ncbi:MAG TPA: hypothetical protein VF591_18760 [Pyrinomonadaceae bacterium]|jgi:hypothetical protein
MPAYTNPLEHVRVAAPCPADWGKMVGDERVRYCDRCSLHVYNLSGMTRREAEALVTNAEGRLCVRYYRRPDGTILTRNCPVGLSALKRRAARAATATMTAVLGFCAALGLNFGLDRALSPSIMEKSAVPAPPMPEVEDQAEDVEPIMGWMDSPPIQGEAVLGTFVSDDEYQTERPAAPARRKFRRQR